MCFDGKRGYVGPLGNDFNLLAHGDLEELTDTLRITKK
jgi:hypothetical protein